MALAAGDVAGGHPYIQVMFETFSATVIDSEGPLRLGAFLGVLAVMLLAEMLWPRRQRVAGRSGRWFGNLGIVIVDAAIVRLLFPLAAVGAAAVAAEQGWGLLHVVPSPAWLAFAVSLVVLDLAIWAQHWVFHHVPLLWRLHRMHHTDVDIDATTALRFHPLEIALSMLLKMALVLILGAPVAAVILFELILNGMAMFNHANLRLPAGAERLLRALVVTPDMHRVHHSIHADETDSNFGFNLSLWDRLFGTYRPAPRDGHEGMTIGLEIFRAPAETRLDRLLLQPFRRP